MLAAEGASPVILHHTGKAESSKQYRGSSDIKASVECAYLLDRLGEQTEGLASLRLMPFKSRLSLPNTIRLQCVSGRFSISQDKAETNREIIERIIQTHPGLAESALVLEARDAGIAKHRAENLLANGIREGWLEVDIGKRGRKTYRIPEVELGE